MRRKTFRRCRDALLGALLGLTVASTSAVADALTAPVDAALAEARSANAAVIVDFYAPWCYSCYFMARHVEHGADWDALTRRAVVIKLDADSPAGAHWMAALGVKGLPSYVVLDAGGRELGRIGLERTRAQFYPEIDAILKRGRAFETIQAQVRDGSAASRAAAREVLATYATRRDPQAAEAWLARLPAAARKAVDADPAASLWRARLRLHAASAAGDAAACAVVAPTVLAGELGCERAYELSRVLSCTMALPAAQRRALLAPQWPAMTALLDRDVLVPTPRCADARSVVTTSAELADALGDGRRRDAVLARAIADAETRLGGAATLDPTRDRNAADNLRLYLDLAGDHARLDALFAELIAAYPDDYVYAYRQGRSLVERGEHARALAPLAQAAAKAYGINRLVVAGYRVDALRALGREQDARRVVAETLKANGPFFPDEVARLKARLG